MSLCLALLLLTAADDARRPTSVTFEAPTGCPTRERFEQELVFRTNRVQLVTDPSAATAHIEVNISEVKRRFAGRLTVRTADGKNITKELKGPKCESVTAALSLAAALVLDPEGTNTAPLPASLPAVVAEPAPEPKPQPVIAGAPEEPKRVEPVVPPTNLIEPVAPPSPRSSSFGLGVFALGVMSTTVSGAPDFGGGVGAELALAPSEASVLRITSCLALALTSGRTVTSTAGSAAYPLGFGGLLGVGAALQLGAFRPEVGVSAQVTSISIAGLSADQNLTSQRWLFAAGPHVRATLEFAGWLVALEGMLAVTALREQYRIDPDGLVFQVPPLGAVAQLQFGRNFP